MNIELKITEKEKEFIKQYAKLYREERDIDCTRDPIVVVRERDHVVSEVGYHDDIIFTVTTDCESLFTFDKRISYEMLKEEFSTLISDEEEPELRNLFDSVINAEDEYEENGESFSIGDYFVKKYYVKYVHKTVAYFLTRKEAEKYVEYQGHNLKDPSVYSYYSGYGNNGDLVSMMSLLRRAGDKMIEAEEVEESAITLKGDQNEDSARRERL